MSREISAGIEHVPELEHHEEREDVAFLQSREPHSRAELQVAQIGERSHIGVLANVDETKEQEEEDAARDENHALHATIDDEGIAIAGLVVHHPLSRRQQAKSRSLSVSTDSSPTALAQSERTISGAPFT